jgi:hypothetical protein
MIVPEVKPQGDPALAFGISENYLYWALDYAFVLGKNHNSLLTADQAARNVIQSLAGRNAIKVVRSQVNGLTETTSVDGVSTKLMELYEEVRKLRQDIITSNGTGLRVIKNDYEGA